MAKQKARTNILIEYTDGIYDLTAMKVGHSVEVFQRVCTRERAYSGITMKLSPAQRQAFVNQVKAMQAKALRELRKKLIEVSKIP